MSVGQIVGFQTATSTSSCQYHFLSCLDIFKQSFMLIIKLNPQPLNLKHETPVDNLMLFFYLVVHYLAVGYHNRISFKRSLSKQHLISDNTQRPPVTLHSIRSPWPIHTRQDFRRNVLWGSYWHLTVHLKHRICICCGSIFFGLKIFKPVSWFLLPFVSDYGNECSTLMYKGK